MLNSLEQSTSESWTLGVENTFLGVTNIPDSPPTSDIDQKTFFLGYVRTIWSVSRAVSPSIKPFSASRVNDLLRACFAVTAN